MALDANLEVFPAGTAQVLEYWLDVSRFSQWKRPALKLPWRRDVVEADVATYMARGIRHVTSFAVYVDAEYRPSTASRASSPSTVRPWRVAPTPVDPAS